MITKISGGRVLDGGVCRAGVSLYFADGKIQSVTSESLPFDIEINADGAYVAPGFIELHSHGGGGADFMDGGVEPFVTAAGMHLKHGTTGMVATSLASSNESITAFLKDYRQAKEICPSLLGVHLEGPYFSPEQAGAQNPAYLRAPMPNEYLPILKAHSADILRWDFAPELPGSQEFCKALEQYGVIPAIAHSNAYLDDVDGVYRLGCRLITHLYSCTSTIRRVGGYRKLGVTESAYCYPNMDVELIADGHHLPPELLRMIFNIKDFRHIALVTDSMRGAGMPDGPSFLGRKGEEIPCIIEDGVAKLPDRSAFAGSVATSDVLLRTAVKAVGIPIEQAVLLLTENPARILGIKNKGNLHPGSDADIVCFDGDVNILKVFSKGRYIT